MLHMKYFFYFIFLHCIIAKLQLNLYFTDQNQVSVNEYDKIGVRYNCLRFTDDVEYMNDIRNIAPVCLGESSLKFPIENEYSLEKFHFDDLLKKKITSEQLYLWSIPIDIIEQYEYYLETNDSSLTKQFMYNCTLPRFGPMCQYELSYYHKNYSSLGRLFNDYKRFANSYSMNMTCYTHLKCNRGYPPACLDWTEICDGKVDCLDGDYDEEYCWQLELNECERDEYRCKNGQCIPKEFVGDNQGYFDCLDKSDESLKVQEELFTFFTTMLMSEHNDANCQKTFLTSSCAVKRPHQIIESMFSIKDSFVTDKCWSAFLCYFAMENSEYPTISHDTIETQCIPAIRKECPDMLYVPNVPIYFGHVYTAYRKNDEPFFRDHILPYLCSNRSFHNGSLQLVSNISLNNTKCFISPKPTRFLASNLPSYDFRYTEVMNNIFQQIKHLNPINNFLSNQCDGLNLYKCLNSSKCISFYRLVDGISDCPYTDDEYLDKDTNPQLFIRLENKYSKCQFNTSISKKLISNGRCDCGYGSFLPCEEDISETFDDYIKRTISFQTICDGFTELSSIIINGQTETDETECNLWECNNIYTRCDGISNCFYGEDELGCDISSTLINCSSDTRICVTFDTYQLKCLPLNQINDGQVDCFGGSDERDVCSRTHSRPKQFYCMNTVPSRCFLAGSLCNSRSECRYNDDEIFCQTNRTISAMYGICFGDHLIMATNIEKFLCTYFKTKYKRKKIYFRINGFNESSENEHNQNELVYSPIDTNFTALLDRPRCHNGIDVLVWLNQSSNNYTNTCLCPSTSYGNECQYQNERISLSIRFQALTGSWQIPFAIVILLIDNTNQRIIHSYEQFTYLSIRDCGIKFNLHLLYLTRPKNINKTYSIHIDIYEKSSLKYRASFLYPIKFLFLPVYRLSLIVNIPSESDYSCSDHQCQHGKCMKYLNEKQTFCQCDQGWSGEYCHIQHQCNCLSNSVCIGISSYNRSICLCPKNQFGTRCYLRHRICEKSLCQNNGTCISNDDFILSNTEKYFCICSKGYSGDQCEITDTQVIIIFDDEMHLSHSIFIHFIRIIPFDELELSIPQTSPHRSTTSQTISQATNSIQIYWSQPFHLTFIETLDNVYYLAILQSRDTRLTQITRTIDKSYHCPSIKELVNETFAQFHILRRMKSYHSICQRYSSNLQCFHDNDTHLCLCYDHQGKRLANCFRFNHLMKFDCSGQSACENDGQCFQDSPTCPRQFICACRSCYYGLRCQFSTSEFGLSLDAILAYHIIPNLNVFRQTTIVKISFSLTILFFIIGIINGILSFITFQNSSVREVGCGIYLFGSSITTLLTMIMFGLKYFIYLSTQISSTSSETFLQIQCYSLDFLLRICLNMDQWLNACVALERSITVIQGVRFNKKKSRELAKKMIVSLLTLNILTSIHDPIYRQLSEEENENGDNKRIWCVVKYSLNLQVYNRILNTFHFFVPFLINFISSIILITKKSYQRSQLHQNQLYKDILHQQLREHRSLLIAPVVLFLLALPRLVLSYVSKCMNSTRDSWLFLSGYFISFIPPMITFLIFVTPSEFYRKEYRKSIVYYQN